MIQFINNLIDQSVLSDNPLSLRSKFPSESKRWELNLKKQQNVTSPTLHVCLLISWSLLCAVWFQWTIWICGWIFFSPIQVIRLFEIVQVVEYILIKGFCFGYKEPTLHLFSSRRCKLYITGNILYKNQRRHLLCRVFTTQSSQNRPTLRLTARDGSPLGTPNA